MIKLNIFKSIKNRITERTILFWKGLLALMYALGWPLFALLTFWLLGLPTEINTVEPFPIPEMALLFVILVVGWVYVAYLGHQIVDYYSNKSHELWLASYKKHVIERHVLMAKDENGGKA